MTLTIMIFLNPFAGFFLSLEFFSIIQIHLFIHKTKQKLRIAQCLEIY